MKIKFRDIKPGMYPAKITGIEEASGPYGAYLRFNFTIMEGELKDWSFYGIVKPNSFKQSKFYRWMIKLVGNEPASDFCVYQLMGNECRILLQKKCKEGEDKIYYSVADIEEKGE